MKRPFSAFILIAVLLSIINAEAQRDVIISNKFLTAKISLLGAQLQSITDNVSRREYLWQGDSIYWADRAPIMFPIIVRLKDDCFTYQGRRIEMPKMGIAKISNFLVIQNDSDRVILELTNNVKTMVHYPFSFRLTVSYLLEGNKILNEFKIENTGEKTMYFTLGGHPGFRFTDYEKDRRYLQYTFSKKMTISRIDIKNSLIQSTKIQFLKNEDRLNLDDSRIPVGGMYVPNIPSRIIGIGYSDNDPFVEVDLGNFPNVNLWSPPGMPYACIEPLVTHHDMENSPMEVEMKSGIVSLPIQKSKSYYFSIIIKDLGKVKKN